MRSMLSPRRCGSRPTIRRRLNNLGAAEYAQEKYGDAAKAFQQAAKAKPDFADAEYNLGNAYLMSGKYTEAAECLSTGDYA